MERKTSEMERVNRIIEHSAWKSCLEKNAGQEKGRLSCHHDLAHFMDVARIARIENLEKELGVDPEMIYAAALLHDIGKHLQYTDGIPHEEGSAALAQGILQDCGFTREEQREILSAIRLHRNPETGGREDLAGLLYRADKASRLCMLCPVWSECNWSNKKNNRTIKV